MQHKRIFFSMLEVQAEDTTETHAWATSQTYHFYVNYRIIILTICFLHNVLSMLCKQARKNAHDL